MEQAKSMRGRFRHKVDIQVRQITEDEFLSSETTWKTKFWHVPCRIVPISARESVYLKREGVEITHRMYCAKIDLLETDHVVFGKRSLEIVSIRNPDEEDQYFVVELLERK